MRRSAQQHDQTRKPLHRGARPPLPQGAEASGGGRRRHQPEATVLYRIVAQHLETFLAEAREHYDKPLPGYVEKELREYLRCGLLPYGFARCVCDRCGQSILVAFSCKRRGLCPSCNARRMCNSAAFLVQHVIPDVPVRQWVLSVPFELRLLLAKRSDALNYVGRVFVKEVFRWQREQAHVFGLEHVRSGAIEWPQRFGGSLNLNVHYHLAVPDGVFTRSAEGARARFHRLAPPGPSDLEDIALNVSVRVERWLRRKQLLLDTEEALFNNFNNQTPEATPLDACLQGSLGIGELTCLPEDRSSCVADTVEPLLPKPTKAGRRGGQWRGFDVHAGVVVSGSDREGRERLLRYCARPPLSLERLSVTPQGLVAYRVRKPWSAEQTHRLMPPLAFMARLAALVPPPRSPLIRFHGVFGPHCGWRASVVPQVSTGAEQEREHRSGHGCLPATVASQAAPGEPEPDSSVKLAVAPAVMAQPPTAPGPTQAKAARDDSIGPRLSAPWRIDWATLLKRTYREDVLACPCGGRRRLWAVVTEPETARSILKSMGLAADPPPVARARSPCIEPEPWAADWAEWD
jgi:hypothetical protein